SLVTIGGAVAVPVSSEKYSIEAHSFYVRQRFAKRIGPLKLQASAELPSHGHLQAVVHREAESLDAVQSPWGQTENWHALIGICNGIDRDSVHGIAWTGQKGFVRVASGG